MKIIFVCTGNTCRSPMAEVFADAIFKSKNLDIQTESRGVFVTQGEPASDYSKLVARNYNLSLENHVARQISKEDIESADLILAMTLEHKKMLEKMCPPEKLFTLKGYALGIDGNISDPYGQGPAIYMECAEDIIDCINRASDKLIGIEKGDAQ